MTIPELACLLDTKNQVINPLFLEWGRQLQRWVHVISHTPTPIGDFLLWGLEHGASAESCLPLFDMVLRHLDGNIKNNKSDALKTLKENHPDALQAMFKGLWCSESKGEFSVDPIWSTALIFKYAPDPMALYNPTIYQARTPIVWAKQWSVQSNLSHCAVEDLPHRLMLDSMGAEAYRLWQLGAWYDLLSRNQHIDNTGGTTYSPYAALRCVVFPGLIIHEAPTPKMFMDMCFKRYKGKKMTHDLLQGAHVAMEWAEANQRADAVAYCSTLLQHLIPQAIKEGLHNTSEAALLDRTVIKCAARGQLQTTNTWLWLQHRHPSVVRRPIANNVLARAPVDVLVHVVQTYHTTPAGLGDSIHQWCSSMAYSKNSAQAVVEALTDEQWATLLNEWNTPSRSAVLCSLLCAEHPRIETLKRKPQARIALAAESLRFLDKVGDLQAEANTMLLWNRENTNLTSLALPQPIALFAA